MHGHNANFLANPKNYLQQNAIECYNIKASAMKAAINSAGGNGDSTTCNVVLEFDLVPQPGNYVSLVILGPVGSYGRTWRWGRPIVGAWMPYLGQISNPDANKIGRINLTTIGANVNYVFSAGLGGCNFVVQQEPAGKVLYHEPTAADWSGQNPAYGGANLLRAGPAYDDASGAVGGFGMAERHMGGWRLLFQLVKGTTVQAVTEHQVP